MADLVIDIGNSRVKVARFEDAGTFELLNAEDLQFVRKEDIDRMIVSNVRSEVPEPINSWLTPGIETHWFSVDSDHGINIPSEAYTVGTDRLANLAGARAAFPEGPVMAIDLGTCMTFSILSGEHEFTGGHISPGYRSRLRAMHEFTGKLPEVSPEGPYSFPALSTTEAMRTGAWLGIVAEIDKVIETTDRTFNETVHTIITGGDLPFFEDHLKNNIFADSFLTMKGLYAILQRHRTHSAR